MLGKACEVLDDGSVPWLEAQEAEVRQAGRLSAAHSNVQASLLHIKKGLKQGPVLAPFASLAPLASLASLPLVGVAWLGVALPWVVGSACIASLFYMCVFVFLQVFWICKCLGYCFCHLPVRLPSSSIVFC